MQHRGQRWGQRGSSLLLHTPPEPWHTEGAPASSRPLCRWVVSRQSLTPGQQAALSSKSRLLWGTGCLPSEGWSVVLKGASLQLSLYQRLRETMEGRRNLMGYYAA